MKATDELIRRLRQKQGDRTQAAFAEALGISKSTLSRLYSQEREIGLATLQRIAVRYPDLAYLFLSESVDESDVRVDTANRQHVCEPEAVK